MELYFLLVSPGESQRTEVRKWCGSQGRFRKEKAQVEDGQEPVFEVATILDPVKNTVTTLHMDTTTANVVHLPQGTLHPYVDRDDKGHPDLSGSEGKGGEAGRKDDRWRLRGGQTGDANQTAGNSGEDQPVD